MKRAVVWVVAAAVLVYLFLLKPKGKVGTVKQPSSGGGSILGTGAKIGALVDGVFTFGKDLFQSGRDSSTQPGSTVGGEAPATVNAPDDWTQATVEVGVGEGIIT